MKLSTCLIFITLFLVGWEYAPLQTSTPITPPNGLEWGMSYENVKNHLEKNLAKKKRLKVDKLKSHKNFPPGYDGAKIKKLKLLDRKAKDAYAFFSKQNQLGAILYTFRWKNDEKTEGIFSSKGKGRAKCWQFQQKLVEILKVKYGDPLKDETVGTHGEAIESGVKMVTVWKDAEGHELEVAITRKKTNAIIARLDDYFVTLAYASADYLKAMQSKVMASDEI